MLTLQTASFNGNSMILNHKAGANVLREYFSGVFPGTKNKVRSTTKYF